MAQTPIVCNVKGPVVKPANLGLRPLQPVPKATDVPSLVKAVQVLSNNFNTVYQFVQSLPDVYTVVNNNFPGGAGNTENVGGAGGGGAFSGFQTKKEKGEWKERSRSTKKIKVTNPDDEEQFVMVEVITELVMQNNATGERWTWRY